MAATNQPLKRSVADAAPLPSVMARQDYAAGGAGQTVTIRDLPAHERPRERLRLLGAGQLSNPELISILLRTGVAGQSVMQLAARMLSAFGGLNGVARASFAELCALGGVSQAKACQVLAALELGRRAVSPAPADRPAIREAEDVYHLLRAQMAHLEQEQLRVLLLNTRREVLLVQEIYRGTVSAASVRVAEVLRPAIRENCPNVIAVHNHPSGDPTPSPEDISVTRRLRKSADLLDIALLDHVVIGARGFVSMKQRGLGFDGSASP